MIRGQDEGCRALQSSQSWRAPLGGIGKGTLGVLGRELWVYWEGNFGCIGKGTLGVLGRELWVYWEGNFGCIGNGTLGVLGRELWAYWEGDFGWIGKGSLRGLGRELLRRLGRGLMKVVEVADLSSFVRSQGLAPLQC